MDYPRLPAPGSQLPLLANPLPRRIGGFRTGQVRRHGGLGLGCRLAPDLRADEPCGELVRLPLRAPPVAVLERPGEPAPVLSPLYLEEAGLRVGEYPHPVPAPLAGAVGAPTSFRACHHSIPLVMDCTICANETSRTDGFSASRPTRRAPILPALGAARSDSEATAFSES